jgi:hypothetical protein
MAPLLSSAWIIVWLVSLVVVAVTMAHTLPLDAVARTSSAEPQTQSVDIVKTEGSCAALNTQGNHRMTIDELHDLQDQLCPTLSDPQRTGN